MAKEVQLRAERRAGELLREAANPTVIDDRGAGISDHVWELQELVAILEQNGKEQRKAS